MLNRLWAAVNRRRPENGFTTTAWMESGWVSQPFYGIREWSR
jgi:hypothetical protein